jgi:stage V sporulation protein B
VAPPDEPRDDAARGAGRGGLFIAGAKIYFILVGFLQQTILPRLIGLDGYGAYSVVQGFSNVPNNVVTTASIQGVSRAVASAGAEGEASAQRRALLVHALIGPFVALPFVLVAPLVARFVHSPALVTPLRVFGWTLLVYTLYTPLVSALNGRRRFFAQAGLDVTFATFRTLGMLGGAYFLSKWMDGVTGAALGIAIAATAILPFALFAAGLGKKGDFGPTALSHLKVLLPIALAQLAMNLLMQADLWLLARFAHESGARAGLDALALRTATDKLVGAYKAAQLFAFLPTQLLLSITFILFPMVARAHAENDRDAVARYVRTGFRIAVVLAALMVSCTSGLAPELISLLFPAEAAERAGTALRLLSVGQGMFALFALSTTVLVSVGREVRSLLLTTAAALLVVLFCWLMVPSRPFDASLLLATALATSLALLLATSAGAALVKRWAGGFVPWRTVVRSVFAMALAAGAGMVLPHGGRLLTVVDAVVVAALFLAVLLATRELTRADRDLVLRVLRRKT